jgi:hypothetical protein
MRSNHGKTGLITMHRKVPGLHLATWKSISGMLYAELHNMSAPNMTKPALTEMRDLQEHMGLLTPQVTAKDLFCNMIRRSASEISATAPRLGV